MTSSLWNIQRLTIKEVIAWIDRYLADPRLSSEALLRKRWAWLWMVVTFIMVLITVLYLLLVLNVWPLWWSGAAFIGCYLVAFLLYNRVQRFDLVINITFSLFIIFIFFAMLQIGGFPSSMGFVFVGVNCAMGSVLAGNLRWTVGMFILYCVTIVLVGIFQPFLETPDYITQEINTKSFVFLTLWINACIVLLVVMFMKDKSRYEKAEADRLKKLDEAKSQLYMNLSHEFRTQLTVIQGIADQLDQHPDRWLHTGPGKIKEQSQLLLRLVNQMLDIAKIEAKSMHLHQIHGNISEFVKYVASVFETLVENKNIELKVETHGSIYADYDPEKLMHVLVNLISNAIKFTPAGGHVAVYLLQVSEKGKQKIKIRVSDTGRGIPQEFIGKIFDRFYQVPDAHDQTPGTGLGLALTRELIRLMQGHIHVKSEEGRGTEFVCTLPLTETAQPADDHGLSLLLTNPLQTIIPVHEKGEKAEINPKLPSDKPILLIVEDNRDVIDYLVTILEEQYVIKIAANGKEGLDKAQDIIPDLILTDLMMPQMDGLQMVHHLKDDIRTDHIPVVVLTVRADLQSKLTGLQTGADHYLVKPFSEQELILKLKNLLESRQKMQKRLGAVPITSQQGHPHYRQELLFMAKINALLDERLDDDSFGIGEICKSLKMSRPQLYRKFSAITDKSIGRYIRSYRLHQAKALIQKQGKNVTEAALSSGFKNLSHFSTSFREEFGYPPSELL
jgi:signal transduction histidine kinase/DNA-binding response OmpR family regulator